MPCRLLRGLVSFVNPFPASAPIYFHTTYFLPSHTTYICSNVQLTQVNQPGIYGKNKGGGQVAAVMTAAAHEPYCTDETLDVDLLDFALSTSNLRASAVVDKAYARLRRLFKQLVVAPLTADGSTPDGVL